MLKSTPKRFILGKNNTFNLNANQFPTSYF